MNGTAFNTLTLEHGSPLVPPPRTNVEILELVFSKLEKLGRVKLHDAADVHLAVRLRDVSIDNHIFAPITHSHGKYAEMRSAMRERAIRADVLQTRSRVRSTDMGLAHQTEFNEGDNHSLYTDRAYEVPGYGARQFSHSKRDKGQNQRQVSFSGSHARRRPEHPGKSDSGRKWSGPPMCFFLRQTQVSQLKS
jgi:hypothetical protein